MPLLEVTQTKQVSASIRLTEATATQTDQYAGYIRACADDVVEQAPPQVVGHDHGIEDLVAERPAGGPWDSDISTSS